jgi:hypothetical protein
VERAVVGPIALAADVVEALEERQELLEVVEALELVFLDRLAPGMGHADSMPNQSPGRKLEIFTLTGSRKSKRSAEQDCSLPPFLSSAI